MSKAVFRSLCLAATVLAASNLVSSQSTDQLFPTPVRSSEIVSTIKARDIGDSRLTTYFYTFEGEQGDVFINVQSKSFSGDIDLFVVPTQVPLTKIVVYADQAETETGRVIYLRKPERLLLRIQGRTPGDDEATVRIKFAGSFAASKLGDPSGPDVPRIDSATDTNIRVNSVGTILEVIPKVRPTPDGVAGRDVQQVEDPDSKPADENPSTAQQKVDPVAEKKDEQIDPTETERKKVEVVVTDPITEASRTPATPRRSTRSRRNTAARTPPPAPVSGNEDTPEVPVVTPTSRSTTPARRSRTPKPEVPPKVDPMANIRLVIYFKDGSTIERPMPEVQRFSVERAVLTVIHKNGTIGRYNMIDVLRVSIE